MRIIKFSKYNFKKTATQAIDSINKGGVVVCPTDTVYGLLCDATNKKAVERVFKIKKSDRSKKFPIFIKDIETAKEVAFINEKQERILRENWPGKITFVLNGKDKRISFLFAADHTIALRIPRHKLVNKILEKAGKPLVQTSANISGESAPTKIREVINYFKDEENQPVLIINAGNLPENKPSTIIDLTKNKTKILRP
jgi:L-threonylcarbamoyladenylate synthase